MVKRKILQGRGNSASIQPNDERSITVELSETIINNINRRCNRLINEIVEAYNQLIHPHRYMTDVGFNREFLVNSTADYHGLRINHFLELFGSLYQLSYGYQAQFYHIVDYYDRFKTHHANIFRHLSAYILFHRNIKI